MMPDKRSERFVEQIGTGRVSGRRWLPDVSAAPDTPLIVALHGGTYTSAYFDLPGFSLIDRAAAAHIPIVALDRPCYGETTPLAPGMETILNSAERLDVIIGDMVGLPPERPVVLLGHSIGAAIALSIAARAPSWPLAGIAVSGLCLQSPPEAGAAWSSLPDAIMIDLPSDLKDGVMFGPDPTFDPPMPGASHAADAPVPRAELIDIAMNWPDFAPDILGKVRVPVHYRLAEFDRLWVSTADQVAAFADTLSGAPSVDAALVSDAGHCIDFHRAGAAFQNEQIAFSLRCTAGTAA